MINKISKNIIIFPILFSLIIQESYVYGRSILEPMLYPVEVTGNNQPYFIWKDIYNKRDRNRQTKYKIILKKKGEKKSKQKKYVFIPDLYYKYFYAFKIPEKLENSKYEYSIQRMVNSRHENSKYFYYLYYPIISNFTVDPGNKSPIDTLPPEYLIKYKYIEKNNLLQNGYTSLFSLSASTLSLGLGILFWKYIDLGIISTIIYTLCFTSSAAGYGAAGYYGYRYFSGKSRLEEIIEAGKNDPGKGKRNRKNIYTGVELKF